MQKHVAALFSVLFIGLMLLLVPRFGLAVLIWPSFAVGAGLIVWLILSYRNSKAQELGDRAGPEASVKS